MTKFELGQLVYWNDPAGETSGVYTVVVPPCVDDNDTNCGKGDVNYSDAIITIADDFSEAEVYACELIPLPMPYRRGALWKAMLVYLIKIAKFVVNNRI